MPKAGRQAAAVEIGATAMAWNGCDTALFTSKPGAATAALAAYPYLSQGVLTVYAGAMSVGRGLEYLIEVAAAVHTTAPEITFAFCGDGPMAFLGEDTSLDDAG